MTIQLSSTQVQQNFGVVLGRALRGEDVIIERYGAPRAVIVEYERYRAMAAVESAGGQVQATDAPESETNRPARLGEPAAGYQTEGSHAPAANAAYRYVTTVPGVCGGQPVIRGTRVPVRAIVGYHRLGMGVDEILAGLPHLTPAQVYEALSFYHDHRDVIERDILEGEPKQLIQRYGLQVTEDGRLVPQG